MKRLRRFSCPLLSLAFILAYASFYPVASAIIESQPTAAAGVITGQPVAPSSRLAAWQEFARLSNPYLPALDAPDFARLMVKTTLAPETLDKDHQVAAWQIREAVGAYANTVFKQVDQLDAASDKPGHGAPALYWALSDLRDMFLLLPDELHPQLQTYKEKAAQHYIRQLRAMGEAAEKEWLKDADQQAPAANQPDQALSEEKARVWSRYGALRKAPSELPADPQNTPIGLDPRFQEWMQNSQNPHAQFAAQLAANLTWKEADLLDRQDGIHIFAAKQGCEHCCLGCMVRAGDRRPIQQMSWTDFTSSVRALVGLQEALRTIRGKPYTLINKKFIVPFYDSEPMSILLRAKAGPPKTIFDMVKFIYATAGVPSEIVSSGWNPKDPRVEGAARALVRDIVADQAPYLKLADGFAKLVIQVKPVAKRFQDEARAFITPILAQDASFQGYFGEDFDKFGFDFNKYPNGRGPPAYQAYRKLVQAHLQDFLNSSSYMRDRLANLITLAPAMAQEQVMLNVYSSSLRNPGESDAAVLFLAPWMEPDSADMMRAYLRQGWEENTGMEMSHDLTVDWTLSHRGPLEESSYLGAPIALFNGAIGFSGATIGAINPRVPNMATDRLESVRNLSDKPVLPMSQERPLWSVAADRLDGTRHLDIADPVRRSIAGRISEVSHGAISPSVEQIGARAILTSLPGRRPDAWVEVHAAGTTYRFRFADGYLYDASDPPKLVAPR